MSNPDPFKGFHSSPEIIRLAVMLYFRFPLSLRNVEDLPHERGVDFSHETARYLWHRFGSKFASEIRKRRIEGMKSSKWRWHLDEIFVNINGERYYLWRAVDHEGEVLESFVTKKRYKKAALKFIKKAMRMHGCPDVFVTDLLRFFWNGTEGNWGATPPRNWSLAEQSCREFSPAVPTTGEGDAPFQAYAKLAEVRLRPRLDL